MRKKAISAVVVLIIWICTRAVAGESGVKLQPVTLQLCASISSGHAPYALGIENGIFAKYGIDLTIKAGKGCGDVTKALLDGTARFGIQDPLVTTVVNGNESEATLKVILGLLQNTSAAYISLAENKFKSPKDYKGKRIAVLKGGRDQTLLKPLLNANGLLESDVSMVEFPNPESKFEALMSGQVDVAGHTYYETPGWTKRGGKQLTAFRADTYGLSVPGDALAINKRFMEKNEDRNLNCRMVKAFTESWEAAMKEPGAATEALLRLTPKYENGDHEIVRETWMLFSALSQLRALRKMPFGFIFIEDWRHLVDIAKDYKLTKKTYPPEEYFTNEYLNCQL